MSLGPLMVDIAGIELNADDIRVLSHPLVGSVLLFTRNYSNPQQLARLTASIRELRTPHLLIAVDHEGGRVQRFRDGFTRLPAARLLGRRFDEDRREALNLAQSVGWLMAAELRAFGACVRDNTPEPVSAEHARHVLEVMLAAEESSRSGREVRLP